MTQREHGMAGIDAAEKQRRLAAVNAARASVALEGIQLTEADERHAQRYIQGDITLEAFVQRRL